MRFPLRLLAIVYVLPFKLVGAVVYFSVLGFRAGWQTSDQLVDYLDGRSK